MKSVVFSAESNVYQVSLIVYAGMVCEIPQDRRKGDNSHYFKVITTSGCSFCHFKNEDSAVKARGILAAKLDACKSSLFRHGREVIDPKYIVSFTNALTLKNPKNEKTHAIAVTVQTADANNAKLWLMYNSQEQAQKGWKALYASIHNANNVSKNDSAPAQNETVALGASASQNLPF